MANVSEKFGLRPYRKLDGTPLVGAQNRYTIKANYNQNIFQGDLVIPVSTGNIERHVKNTSEAVGGHVSFQPAILKHQNHHWKKRSWLS